jgi:hypothetical protein
LKDKDKRTKIFPRETKPAVELNTADRTDTPPLSRGSSQSFKRNVEAASLHSSLESSLTALQIIIPYRSTFAADEVSGDAYPWKPMRSPVRLFCASAVRSQLLLPNCDYTVCGRLQFDVAISPLKPGEQQ